MSVRAATTTKNKNNNNSSYVPFHFVPYNCQGEYCGMWHVEINTEPSRTAAQHVMNENENEKQRLPKITQNEVFPAGKAFAL